MSITKQYIEEKWGERLPEQPSWVGANAPLGKGAAWGGGLSATMGGIGGAIIGGPAGGIIGLGLGGALGALFGLIVAQEGKTAQDRAIFVEQIDRCVKANPKSEKKFMDCVRKKVRGGKQLSEIELKVLYRSRKFDPEVAERAGRAAEQSVKGLTDDPEKEKQLQRIAKTAGKAAGSASEKRKREKLAQQLCGNLSQDEYLRCMGKYGLLSPEEAREYMQMYG